MLFNYSTKITESPSAAASPKGSFLRVVLYPACGVVGLNAPLGNYASVFPHASADAVESVGGLHLFLLEWSLFQFGQLQWRESVGRSSAMQNADPWCLRMLSRNRFILGRLHPSLFPAAVKFFRCLV